MEIIFERLPDNYKTFTFRAENNFDVSVMQEMENLKIIEKLAKNITSKYKKSRSFRNLINNHIHKYKTCKVYNADQESAEIIAKITDDFLKNNTALHLELISNVIYKNDLSFISFNEHIGICDVITQIYINFCWVNTLIELEKLTEIPFCVDILPIESICSTIECDDE